MACHLAEMGFPSTLAYLGHVADLVLRETGLLPHVNAGVMDRDDVAALRQVAVSQGLMLEATAEHLMAPGGAHYECPDKAPAARLATIQAAGEARVPFTSGLLIGIGEMRAERLQALLALRPLHAQHGHLQELIVQNFRAKPGTRMHAFAEPPLEELLWTVAVARLAFGPGMNIQAPPNLTPASDAATAGKEWGALIAAGINDWGGISPVTKDWVNPEAPWPHIATLGEATAMAGKRLVPRLAAYPEYVMEGAKWLDEKVAKHVLNHSDSLGYARAQLWAPGMTMPAPHLAPELRSEPKVTPTHQRWEGEAGPGSGLAGQENSPGGMPPLVGVEVGSDGLLVGRGGGSTQDPVPVSPEVAAILARVASGEVPSEDDVVRLFRARGSDFVAVCRDADRIRAEVNGDEVTYVVNRNINYTNMCTYACQFCAFSKGKANEALRGKAYRLPLEEIARRAAEAWDRGATEVCMQGGIHPEFTGQTYLDILRAVKEAAPDIHVHAFSPLEVFQGAATLGLSVKSFLGQLKEAGLGSLPGTAAEVLDDEVRQVLCPDKISTQEWLEVVEAAHSVGLRTTSTIMFGHVDHPRHWARHLLRLRALQARTGGITEFVPLPFVHMQAPVYLKGRARRGPTMRECALMHAIARLVLHPLITNIQASWVKMGPGGAQALLAVGCNDMGGSLMNESITRAAGAAHGEELGPDEMEALIWSVGRTPVQRTTMYGRPAPQQVARSFAAPALAPIR